MQLKDIVRTRICTSQQHNANELKAFIHWARMIDEDVMQSVLCEIHEELQQEAQHFQQISQLVGRPLLHHQLRLQWCRFCTQLQAYYQPFSAHACASRLH
ncbi:MAG TPA: hypothetical protein VL987_16060 [Cellvibrio sp.]|nr:hypothetical protein [Cellvibrio sp.]